MELKDEVQQIQSKVEVNSTFIIKRDLENFFDRFMNWFYCLLLNRIYRSMMREAKIRLELYRFCVSMGLGTILTSSLNDHTLSILQMVVKIDQVEDRILLSSITFEDQPKKETVYSDNLQLSCLDYGTYSSN